MDDLTRNARAMRREPTPAEKAMWRVLRRRQFEGMRFRRQAPIGPYIADFACFDPKVIIEADGGQHADSATDARRDAWFRSQGFTVLRFWNSEVLDHPESLPELILSRL
jgi:very-short-patch-repair endonuclease